MGHNNKLTNVICSVWKMEADGACDTQAMHSHPYFKQMIPLTALS